MKLRGWSKRPPGKPGGLLDQTVATFSVFENPWFE
jgi:hypothetical protein